MWVAWSSSRANRQLEAYLKTGNIPIDADLMSAALACVYACITTRLLWWWTLDLCIFWRRLAAARARYSRSRDCAQADVASLMWSRWREIGNCTQKQLLILVVNPDLKGQMLKNSWKMMLKMAVIFWCLQKCCGEVAKSTRCSQRKSLRGIFMAKRLHQVNQFVCC